MMVVRHDFINAVSIFGEKVAREIKLSVPLTLVDSVGEKAKFTRNVGG